MPGRGREFNQNPDKGGKRYNYYPDYVNEGLYSKHKQAEDISATGYGHYPQYVRDGLLSRYNAIMDAVAPNSAKSGSGSGSGVGSGSGSSPARNSYTGNRDSSAYWSAQYDRNRFATGGYTGEWNNDPKLAWLDQKELVLNADDTKNILDSVNIVRTITDKVAAITGAAAASMSASSAAGLMSTIGQTILQDVVIHADFPAVEDAAQIKQAFNELVNLASQRASANRRA